MNLHLLVFLFNIFLDNLLENFDPSTFVFLFPLSDSMVVRFYPVIIISRASPTVAIEPRLTRIGGNMMIIVSLDNILELIFRVRQQIHLFGIRNTHLEWFPCCQGLEVHPETSPCAGNFLVEKKSFRLMRTSIQNDLIETKPNFLSQLHKILQRVWKYLYIQWEYTILRTSNNTKYRILLALTNLQ